MKAVVLATALCLAAGVAPRTQGSIPAALDRYSAGDFDAALPQPADQHADRRDAHGRRGLWIAGGGPVAHNRRTYIAAAFGLELLAATSPSRMRLSGGGSYTSPGGRTNIATFGAPLKMIAWACARMRALREPPAGARWWWLSSVALLQQTNDSSTLMGWTKITNWNDVSPEMRALIEAEIADGHLAHAREHVPNEPRLTLAAALANVAKAEVGFYDRPSRNDVLRSLEIWQQRKGTIGSGEIERALGSIADDPVLGAEAEMRLGFFDLRRQRWQSALAHFERARPRVDEPILQAGIESLQRVDLRAHEQIAGRHRGIPQGERDRAAPAQRLDAPVRAALRRQPARRGVLDSRWPRARENAARRSGRGPA